MDPKELKKILRPLVKEVVTEVLAEFGAKAIVAESVSLPKQEPKPSVESTFRKAMIPQRKNDGGAYTDTKKRIDEELKKAGILSKNFNPFDGTQALTEAQAANGTPATQAPGGLDVNDPGVDVSNLIGGNAARWKAHMGGKK